MTDSDDLGRTARDALEGAEKTGREVRSRIAEGAEDAYGRAVAVGRSGYEATSATVSSWPLSSVLIAAGLGLAAGWALRGAAEEDSRRTWMDTIRSGARSRW